MSKCRVGEMGIISVYEMVKGQVVASVYVILHVIKHQN